MPCVYVLHTAAMPDQIRYVGISKEDSPDKRFKSHQYNAKSGASELPVHCWIRKHLDAGEETVYTTVAVVDSWSEAQQLEKTIIAEMRACGHKLLNQTDGGEGTLGHKQSRETREKRARSLRGRVVAEATKEKISIANKGKRRSDEAKEKMRKAKLGKTLTEEHKKNISKSLVGRPVSEKTKELISSSQRGRSLSQQHLENLKEGQRRRRERELLEKTKKYE